MSERILAITDTAQTLISELYAASPEDETFEQLGMLDGQKIVTEHLEHGEPELALQHLLYMIYESSIEFPEEDLAELNAIRKEYGVGNSYDNN